MKTVRSLKKALKIRCDDPRDTFVVRYTNQGEPFREGLSIGIENDEFDKDVEVMLENRDAIQLRDFLVEAYPLGEGK